MMVKKATLVIQVGKRRAYSYDLLELLARCGYSKSEAKRLLLQKAISIYIEVDTKGGGEKMTDDEKTNGEEVTADAPTDGDSASEEKVEEKTE